MLLKIAESKILYSILILILLSCSNTKDKTSEENKPVEISYWPSSNPQEIELAKMVVEEWNRTHPDIKVNMQPIPAGQSTEEVLLTAVAAKTTPDVCSNIWPGSIPDYVAADALVMLDTFPGFKEMLEERIPEGIIDDYRSEDGHFYQVPWKSNPVMMEYNVSLFREAGIEKPPETYNEFFRAAKKLTSDTDNDGNIDRWIAIVNINPVWWHRFFDFYAFYIAASGGKTLFKNGEVNFNDRHAVEVLEFFQEGFEEGYFPLGSPQGNQFLLENVAVQFVGPWDVGYLKKHAPEGLDYNFSPLPVPEGTGDTVYTYGDPKNMVIFSNSEHPLEAWKFIRFMVQKKYDLKLLEITYQLPIRKNLTSDTLFTDFFEKYPRMIKFAEQLPYIRGTDRIQNLKEVFNAIAQTFEACCVYRKLDPEEGVKRAAERSKLVTRRYR